MSVSLRPVGSFPDVPLTSRGCAVQPKSTLAQFVSYRKANLKNLWFYQRVHLYSLFLPKSALVQFGNPLQGYYSGTAYANVYCCTRVSHQDKLVATRGVAQCCSGTVLVQLHSAAAVQLRCSCTVLQRKNVLILGCGLPKQGSGNSGCCTVLQRHSCGTVAQGCSGIMHWCWGVSYQNWEVATRGVCSVLAIMSKVTIMWPVVE